MFNKYVQNFNNSVSIKPACIGILQKSHPQSFFKRFHKSSKMADWIFSEEPCLKKKYREYSEYEKYMDVEVLQVMCFSDEEFLCELIDKKILESYEEQTS